MTTEETPKSRRVLVTAAATVGALLGAAGIAGAVVNAQTADTTDPSTADPTTADLTTADPTDSTTADDTTTTDDTATENEADETHEGRGGNGETALTGQTATDVTNAALAAVPGGTIERVETDADGAAYEAHMLDADAKRVTVTFDESFAVVEITPGR